MDIIMTRQQIHMLRSRTSCPGYVIDRLIIVSHGYHDVSNCDVLRLFNSITYIFWNAKKFLIVILIRVLTVSSTRV